MSSVPLIWDLPGPSAFIADAVEEARRAGFVAIITPRHCPGDLDVALKERLGVFDLPIIDASNGSPPLQMLSRAFDMELKSARSLPYAAEAEGRAVLLIGLDTPSVLRWETTLRAFVSGCSARPLFGAVLVVGASPDCQPLLHQMGVECRAWRNVIGFRDAMLWALRDQKIADPILGRLAVETAVCLAGWELDEVGRQMQRLDRARAIFEIPASLGTQDKLSWAQGEIDELDGIAFKRLASCGPEEIANRIWRAQVTVLFGWLETLRNEFVRQHRVWLHASLRGDPQPTPLSELEWGELTHLARQRLPVGDRGRRFAECAREMRNALAHREAVDFETFQRLRQCIQP